MNLIKTMKEKGYFEFGKIIPNLKINGVDAPYRVLNERSIRATAGIMFLGAFFSFFQALYLKNYIYLEIFVILFFIDFLIKVTIGPTLSPFSVIGRLVVKGQKPEYVGAIQKRFAWSLGLIIATLMILIVHVFEIRGIIPFTLCSICLIFMFMESAFGICVGCKIYYKLIDLNIIQKPQIAPACPGGSCSIKNK